MVDFPNVPDVPGVPALLRDPAAAVADLVLAAADTVSGFGDGNSPQWGLFLNGEQVVRADTVVTFGYRKESDLPTYQQERGAFQSYNKVQHPYDIRFRFARGGSLADRQDFIESVTAVEDTLDLYDAVTPEKTYTNVNVSHVDYRRASHSGPGMISIDINVVQIRDAGQSTFSSTTTNTDTAAIVGPKSPSAASESSGGNVQPEPAASINPVPSEFQ